MNEILIQDEIVNISEACKITGLSKSRIYNEVFHKKIPYIKIGASLRFSRKDLMEWIEQKKRGTNVK